jgi:hypothetical protein
VQEDFFFFFFVGWWVVLTSVAHQTIRYEYTPTLRCASTHARTASINSTCFFSVCQTNNGVHAARSTGQVQLQCSAPSHHAMAMKNVNG